MDTEIELKLFLQHKYKNELIEYLDKLPKSEPKPTLQLGNCYFDTSQLQLRRWKMGLRVRSQEQHRQQTIKTAGSVVGGIHARPEYNVDIQSDTPILKLFPENLWPQEANLADIQSEIVPLFDTDFERRLWHVYCDESLVEIAFDIGYISAGGKTEPICELEFELLAGEAQALVKLAASVASAVPVRLGKASKAQRGYRLAAQSSPLGLEALEFIALPPSLSLNDTLVTLLETGIERWQLIEDMICNSTSMPAESAELWYRLRACVRLLKLTLEQYQMETSELDASFALIESHLVFIEKTQSLAQIVLQRKSLMGKLPQAKVLQQQAKIHLHDLKLAEQLQKLWDLPEYGQLQLALVELMMAAQKGTVLLDKKESLRSFSDRLQEASWQKIVKIMPSKASLSSLDYQQFAQALDESILVGFAYGQLYSTKERDFFRRPWQDLVLGIRTLASYQQLEVLGKESGIDIEQWLEDKSHSLLVAMEHSRRSALATEPYWR